MTCEYCGCPFVTDELGDCRRCSAPPPGDWMVQTNWGEMHKSTSDMLSLAPAPVLSDLEKKLAAIKA